MWLYAVLATMLWGDGVTPEKATALGQAVEAAIDAGYRHIDTSPSYFTEEQVGQAINKKIKDGVVTREEMFITSKLWNDRHARDQVVPALEESMAKLGVEYVDLFLMHWPVATYENDTIADTDYLETWEGLVEAKKMGLAKSIGVGNFNIDQLQRLLDEAAEPPAVLNVEVTLHLQQPELLAFCRDHHVVVEAMTPLGLLFGAVPGREAPPSNASDPALQALSKKYNKRVTQIVFRYLYELGTVPLPQSYSIKATEEDIKIFDFELTEEERDLLKGFDANYRINLNKNWTDSPYYMFEAE